MSAGLTILHSHSGLERELKFPKHIVLIDTKFASLIHALGANTEPFRFGSKDYVKAPVMAFVKAGGVFKNLLE